MSRQTGGSYYTFSINGSTSAQRGRIRPGEEGMTPEERRRHRNAQSARRTRARRAEQVSTLEQRREELALEVADLEYQLLDMKFEQEVKSGLHAYHVRLQKWEKLCDELEETVGESEGVVNDLRTLLQVQLAYDDYAKHHGELTEKEKERILEEVKTRRKVEIGEEQLQNATREKEWISKAYVEGWNYGEAYFTHKRAMEERDEGNKEEGDDSEEGEDLVGQITIDQDLRDYTYYGRE